MRSATSHIDDFVRRHLPAEADQPEFIFDLPELAFPENLNAAQVLVERHCAAGNGKRIAIISNDVRWTYEDLAEKSNQIASVLTQEMGLIPGNRVLLVGPNSPTLVAIWLAVLKAGGVGVAAMPLLRAKDYAKIIDKAEISHALYATSVAEELEAAASQSAYLKHRISFNEDNMAASALHQRMATLPKTFRLVNTKADDPAIIAFTSGTTGEPKGCIHFHRDVLTMAQTFSRHILQPTADDRFMCSAPLAFTFGLGMSVVFPFMVGASTVLLEKGAPAVFADAIGKHKVTIAATAPTGYRAILQDIKSFDLSSLKKCVSAGEHLPEETFKAWESSTNIRLINGIGATEMIHIFISASPAASMAGATGFAVPGYKACIVSEDLKPLPAGEKGRLAVKGPTGCRYLDDSRQSDYVKGGWNLSGDIFHCDEEGRYWYHGRADDMIVSSGYNISAIEVEQAVLKHPSVGECAVIGVPDEERGAIVKAFIVLTESTSPQHALAGDIQTFVKNTIAPYKYPRVISFVDSLPKTNTGKIRRSALRSTS
jgi:2-aminobenzoate-CoA ligase